MLYFASEYLAKARYNQLQREALYAGLLKQLRRSRIV